MGHSALIAQRVCGLKARLCEVQTEWLCSRTAAQTYLSSASCSKRAHSMAPRGEAKAIINKPSCRHRCNTVQAKQHLYQGAPKHAEFKRLLRNCVSRLCWMDSAIGANYIWPSHEQLKDLRPFSNAGCQQQNRRALMHMVQPQGGWQTRHDCCRVPYGHR